MGPPHRAKDSGPIQRDPRAAAQTIGYTNRGHSTGWGHADTALPSHPSVGGSRR